MKSSIYCPDNLHRLGSDFRWKDGKKTCVVVDLAYECWSDGMHSGVGPMGNVLKPGVVDTNAISWGRYGVIRGIHRLLDVLKRHQIRSSVMINGAIAEFYPKDVCKVLDDGHAIHAHSYGMDVIPVYLDEEKERENIRLTTELIVKACGYRPTGWISPRGTRSNNSSKLLIELGYQWHSDAMDDDLPYIEQHSHGSIIAIPFTMEINDMPHSVRYGNSPSEMVRTFIETLDWMTGNEPFPTMMNFTAHTHVYGRPAGALVFDRLLTHVKSRDDVWIATRDEVYEFVRPHLIKLVT
jgi:peptidoglycan/xylan/chitin deacetylase (PgdA/CDA1 family)